MTRPNPTLARLVLAASGLLVATAALLPFVLVDERPDPLATRWSFDGEVTSTMSATALFVLVAVFVIPTATVLGGLALARSQARPGVRSMWAGLAALLGTIFAWASVSTLLANQGHEDWRTVPGPALWQLVVLLVASCIAGALAAWAASGLPERPVVPVSSPPLEVPDTSVVAWSRSSTVRWLLALAVVTGAAGVVLSLLSGEPWIGVVLLLSALPAVLLARIEVFADRRGLTVAYGPWGWPRTRIPIERIAAASPIEIRPSEWGGWGYRGSVRIFRTAAVVLRAGPGIRLDLTDGRRFAVTIDDPGTAAAVLERERRREPAP
ncbi:MAG TPA: hypothetical protein VKZ55_10720 [Microthrixaceae bacterium]|nr:hypothetical protein [Microthrixaceae bacterium]